MTEQKSRNGGGEELSFSLSSHGVINIGLINTTYGVITVSADWALRRPHVPSGRRCRGRPRWWGSGWGAAGIWSARTPSAAYLHTQPIQSLIFRSYFPTSSTRQMLQSRGSESKAISKCHAIASSVHELLLYGLRIWCSNGGSDPLIVQKKVNSNKNVLLPPIQNKYHIIVLVQIRKELGIHISWAAPNLWRIACSNLSSICLDLCLFEAWMLSKGKATTPLLLSKGGGI